MPANKPGKSRRSKSKGAAPQAPPGSGGGQDPFADPRFAAAKSDIRFKPKARNKAKVKVDERFQRMFEDEDFATGGSSAKVDSRGRRIEPSAERQREDLGRIYDLEDKDESGGAAAAGPRRGRRGGKREVARMEAKLEELDRLARGEVQAGDRSDETDSEVEAAEEADEGVDVDEELREDVERGPSTRRLAAVNCDWDNMRAVDLLALFQSFNGAAGAVQRVTVYPSDFGLEQMELEDKYGPQLGPVAKQAGSGRGPPDEPQGKGEVEGEDEDEDEDEGLVAGHAVGDVEQGQTVDQEAMRRYELRRLKYYFAVVECDSAKAAEKVYDGCDGLEYGASSVRMDLRFIPDDVSFSGREPRDSAAELPAGYAPLDFSSNAFQHTRVKLTWDQDDPHRTRVFRELQQGLAKEDDLMAYIASDSDSDSEGEEEEEEVEEAKEGASKKKDKASKAERKKGKRSKYRALVDGLLAGDTGTATTAAQRAAEVDPEAEVGDDFFAGTEDEEAGAEGGGGRGESEGEDEEESEEEEEDEEESEEEDENEDEDEGAALALLEGRAKDTGGAKGIRGKEGDSEVAFGDPRMLESDGEEGEGQETTYVPGAGEELLRKRADKEARAKETPFEAYLRKKKERQAEKRRERRQAAKSQQRQQREEMRGAVREARRKAGPEEEEEGGDRKRKAELELLVAGAESSGEEDAGTQRPGGSRKKSTARGLSRRERRRRAKEEKARAEQEGEKAATTVLQDPRFAGALMEDADYAVDPTSARFRDSETLSRVLARKRSRQTDAEGGEDTGKRRRGGKAASAKGGDRPDRKAELDALVASVKRKSRA